jgi:hypothetical protein
MIFVCAVLFLQIHFGAEWLGKSVPSKPARVLEVGSATWDGRAEEKGTRTASGAVAPETENSIPASAPTAFKSTPEAPDNSNHVRTIHEKHLWYALIGIQHSAATFDAWSTRHSIESGQRRELNPLLRPFSHSGAIYGAIQVAPGFTDFLGYRMMGSRHRWVRWAWWLPQAGSAALYFLSGAYNLRKSP